MIVGSVDPETLPPVPDWIAARPAETLVETFTLDPPLGADLWLWCGLTAPHHDRHLGDVLLVTLSVRSAHGIGDALAAEPEVEFPAGAIAVFDPQTVHWLVPTCTEVADSNGRIELPLWIGLQWVVPRKAIRERVRELIRSLGGTWAPTLDPRHADWVPSNEVSGDEASRTD